MGFHSALSSKNGKEIVGNSWDARNKLLLSRRIAAIPIRATTHPYSMSERYGSHWHWRTSGSGDQELFGSQAARLSRWSPGMPRDYVGCQFLIVQFPRGLFDFPHDGSQTYCGRNGSRLAHACPFFYLGIELMYLRIISKFQVLKSQKSAPTTNMSQA